MTFRILDGTTVVALVRPTTLPTCGDPSIDAKYFATLIRRVARETSSCYEAGFDAWLALGYAKQMETIANHVCSYGFEEVADDVVVVNL